MHTVVAGVFVLAQIAPWERGDDLWGRSVVGVIADDGRPCRHLAGSDVATDVGGSPCYGIVARADANSKVFKIVQ